MPLHDHFSPPLSRERHWEGFHSAWANEIVRRLNHDLLPERFVAEPNIKLGTRVEVDVATLDREFPSSENGGVAVATYAPPRPTIVVDADWSDQDVFEIQVQRDDGGLRLVAAIELVSPANKDRPSQREAFVRKCVGYLQQGVSLIAIDIVTARPGDFHAELMASLNVGEMASDPKILQAAAYRAIPLEAKTRVEIWRHVLSMESELPTLPLWLDLDLAVPIDLEESYQATCDTLRIE